MSYTIPHSPATPLYPELLNPNYLEVDLLFGDASIFYDNPDSESIVSLSFGVLNKSDIGTTISVGSEQPGWAEFISLATDNNDDALFAILRNSTDADGGYMYYGEWDSAFFGDLSGSDITSISFTLVEMTWDYGIYDNGVFDGSVERDYVTDFEGTFDITAVPEFSTSALFIASAMLLFIARKKRFGLSSASR